MITSRIVAVEVLDTLTADDPAAARSRRDLQRVHRVMGTRPILRQALSQLLKSRRHQAPLRILELGAGDGSLMLGIARDLAPIWPRVELTLLDRLELVDHKTIAHYGELGWSAILSVVDVLDWAAEVSVKPPVDKAVKKWDLIVANLFLHHFESAPLAALLGAISLRCDYFFTCEPRRALVALAGSHLIGLIGVGKVTREDAVLSVQAGFRDKEITALWPANANEWRVHEYSTGLFSHCLRAERIGSSDAN